MEDIKYRKYTTSSMAESTTEHSNRSERSSAPLLSSKSAKKNVVGIAGGGADGTSSFHGKYSKDGKDDEDLESLKKDDANGAKTKDTNGKNDKNGKNGQKESKSATPMASLFEVFAFSSHRPHQPHPNDGGTIHPDTTTDTLIYATPTRTRPFLLLGLSSAFITGCVYPAMAFFFAQVFEKFSVSVGDSFMDGIREMAYTFMVLGVIVFFAMSFQNTLLDTAATDMTHAFQKTYFSLLLHQDPTYFDLTDVAGAAGMIGESGKKFHKGVGRKLGEGFQFTITMLGGFAYAFYSSWKVSLVILTVLPIMTLSTMLLMKMISTQSSAAAEGYRHAGEIAYAAVSGIRTVVSLNAVGGTIEKYRGATKEAYDTAAKREWALGFANGAVMGSMLLGYIAITLFGMWLLYDAVSSTGCDPSNAVPMNEPCPTTGMEVFGSLMGISFAAMGLPQISASLEALMGARAAVYPVVVLRKRCEGKYNEEFNKECNEEERESIDGTGATAATLASVDKSVNDKESEEDTPLEELETTHHKKLIPVSKMPPYTIDPSSSGGLHPASCHGTIDFCNVSFSYPSRPQVKVLDNLSLHIESGTTVAIVGHSGCGKSSIMQLLERFYDVDNDNTDGIGDIDINNNGDGDIESGTTKSGIKLDGVDLRELNVKWLRSQIGLVSQEPKLFARSIRDNIAFGLMGVEGAGGVGGVGRGAHEPTQEEIEEAAKMANAHDFISEFPNGYDTFVGDAGAQLSGGQKQRIAIARVLLRRPKILLLDEATSALDSESERTVQRALDQLLSKNHSSDEQSRMTTIVVAHRLSTIKNADLIAVADKGKIVEKGTHTELMAIEGGAYRALVEAQMSRLSTQSNNVDNGNGNGNGDSNHGAPSNDTGNGYNRTSFFVKSNDAMLTAASNEIVLKDVQFHYPTRPATQIFRGINLAVRKGETLALVGPSGQGKSTIMHLIERYYDPTHGTIEFEGRDLKTLNIGYYRDQIGLVSQEPTLFNDTIAANIKYGKPDATDEEMYEAAKKANAHNFITSFPDGYNTQLGETALAVSGGQKQRIAIARAIIKQPRVLLLDEATSALDTASEKVVQEALDAIMANEHVTTIVIAHRLSTIKNADRIAYIGDGKVREIGTHDELMANPESKYRRLQELQHMGIDHEEEETDDAAKSSTKKKKKKAAKVDEKESDVSLEEGKPDKEKEKSNASKARALAKDDKGLLFIGCIGAVIAGLMFPGWGIVFAYMIEYLYYPVLPCDGEIGIMPPPPYSTCEDYWDSVKTEMQQISFKLTYGWLGVIASTMIGNILIYYGIGTASEKMNKRVRDAAFSSLLRQEISYFDFHTVGSLTSRLADDAALIHSFSGQPLRQLVLSLSSVLVGVAVSFVFMWPFALVCLGTIPFMGFGAEMEMKMYMGEDETETKEEENGPGAIAIESLLNIRTVASLSLESVRMDDYTEALTKKDPQVLLTNVKKGSVVSLGQIIQMWGMALMFWWGGWLLWQYPEVFTYRDFLISMFSLLFSLSGLGMAAQGATNRDKASAAAGRIFDLIERESTIDPLSNEGYKPGTP